MSFNRVPRRGNFSFFVEKFDMNKLIKILIGAFLVLAMPVVSADVVSSSADHYKLSHKASSSMAPDALWQKLIQPAIWWHPDHTYSGDSSNLSLDLRAGGHWSEQWADNSVLHGVVLSVDKGKLLRLNAPFGPLQGMAVTVIWTIRIEADGDGSVVMFEELANGVSTSKLDELAGAVDGVKSEALARLVRKSF
jgi:uncharacterized protein YndB with AHSA1/START domain